MNLLTQDDPQYGIAYYRALKLDPDVAKIIAGPALTRPNISYMDCVIRPLTSTEILHSAAFHDDLSGSS